jgi:hypothetical protein
MFKEKASGSDQAKAQQQVNKRLGEGAKGGGVFHVQCFDKDGNLKWEEAFHNLVVNEGLEYMNTIFFTGTSYTATWYLGLVTGPGSGNTYAAANTLASHTGWTEFTNYTGNRKAITFDSITLADPSVSTNTTPVQFTISGGGGTVAGAFLTNVATGTSGKLFSVSNFTSPGDRVVVATDTLNVTYTFNLDAA